MSTALVSHEQLDLPAIIAANIRAEASRRGYNAMDIARALGVSHSPIAKRWRGAQDWQLADIGLVAEVIGVDVSLLLDTSKAPAVGEGRSARLKGLEPPTF